MEKIGALGRKRALFGEKNDLPNERNFVMLAALAPIATIATVAMAAKNVDHVEFLG